MIYAGVSVFRSNEHFANNIAFVRAQSSWNMDRMKEKLNCNFFWLSCWDQALCVFSYESPRIDTVMHSDMHCEDNFAPHGNKDLCILQCRLPEPRGTYSFSNPFPDPLLWREKCASCVITGFAGGQNNLSEIAHEPCARVVITWFICAT